MQFDMSQVDDELDGFTDQDLNDAYDRMMEDVRSDRADYDDAEVERKIDDLLMERAFSNPWKPRTEQQVFDTLKMEGVEHGKALDASHLAYNRNPSASYDAQVRMARELAR